MFFIEKLRRWSYHVLVFPVRHPPPPPLVLFVVEAVPDLLLLYSRRRRPLLRPLILPRPQQYVVVRPPVVRVEAAGDVHGRREVLLMLPLGPGKQKLTNFTKLKGN